MGNCGKMVVDAVLFVFFLTLALITSIFDAETVFPKELLPKYLLGLKHIYATQFGDYLVLDSPDFFVGLTWFNILLVCPFSILNLFAIVAGKSWFRTTCLIQGVAVFTSLVPILADMHLSGKANEKMQKVYYSFLGFSVLAILRGLLTCTGGACVPAAAVKTYPPAARKKRA